MEPKLNSPAVGAGPLNENDGEKPERKLTVLETHGYVLGRTIGAGSYATVKVAKSERHECQVAVKIVSKFQAPGDYLKKFLPREIEVVKGLKHANLIRFLQAIETTHRVYIIMEFAANGSLLDIIRLDTHIEDARSRRWFRQLVDAVDYCHERGVVHRDIKCENLLMDRDSNIKLSDFGFARGHMKPKNGVAPLSETFCGSYAYASPEILRGIPYQPQLSDIWSMGVVLYAMVYGRLPFDDANYAQLLKQVQNKVTFPKEPKVPHACRALIARILTPQRSRLRIADIRDDPWMATLMAVAQTSTADNSLDSLPTLSVTKGERLSLDQQAMIDEPPELLTKEVMAVKPRDNNVPTSDEETPVTDVEPKVTSTQSVIITDDELQEGNGQQADQPAYMMTADSEKDCTLCLICNSKVGVSTRNSVRIFSETSVTSTDKPLVDTICSVLEVDLNEENVHSLVICKKCFKLFNEVDELENRLAEVKLEIFTNYKRTMRKVSDVYQDEDEYNDHDYVDNSESLNSDISGPKFSQKAKKKGASGKRAVGSEHEEKEEKDIEYEKDDEAENEMEDSAQEQEEIVIKVETNVDSESSDGKKAQHKKSKINIKTETVQEQLVAKDGSVYTCLLCPGDEEKAMGDAKAITTHLKAVHDARLYICDICGMEFRKRNELSVHLDDHVANEEGDFQCEVCNRIFSNLRLFRIHKRIHYPQAKSWPCETCGKRYRNLLEEHINTHTGVRPYVCETCGKDFASKYTYKAHVKTHEVRPRPFECQQCNKSFLSQQNLNQHEKTHNGVKEYVCHQCGKAFGSAHNLEVHNIVHTGYKPYICRICTKAFARKAEIRDHERTHTGEKPYQCEFCGATFSQRSNLQSHKRATHYNDKRYKCNDCGKGFKRRRLLDYHIKAAHTGERPFKCGTCTATFVYPEHFKKHMRIHTGEKPYLCEVCGKAFNSRDNRNAHRFIHSDKKPYECLVCGTGFMRKPLLYTHMQTQGHLNDTIVVNQPRLTTDDDQVITIPEGDVELLMESADNEQETELYIAELKDHVIIQQDDEQIYEEGTVLDIPSEGNMSEENVEQLVVDGQINFSENEVMECKAEDPDNVEEVYSYHDSEDGETIVVPATSQYEEIVGDKKNSVRLVQIRIPSSAGGDGRNWLNLVQNA